MLQDPQNIDWKSTYLEGKGCITIREREEIPLLLPCLLCWSLSLFLVLLDHLVVIFIRNSEKVQQVPVTVLRDEARSSSIHWVDILPNQILFSSCGTRSTGWASLKTVIGQNSYWAHGRPGLLWGHPSKPPHCHRCWNFWWVSPQ